MVHGFYNKAGNGPEHAYIGDYHLSDNHNAFSADKNNSGFTHSQHHLASPSQQQIHKDTHHEAPL
jgi:hypothetical protein